MKAIVYTEYGGPDVLQIKAVAQPIPGDSEILVKVCAAEVTKSDCELRSFTFPVKWFWLPLRAVIGFKRPKRQIPGGYFSGIVTSVGKNVSNFRSGDEVFGCAGLRLGAYAEYICLPAAYTIVPKPENISFEAAAAVPLGGLNAIHFMRRANIQKGEKVLVNGAGGSIGTYGVQIARAMGAEVTAVDSALKEAMLRGIGSDHFFDYTKEDFSRSDKTYDVIFDMVAKSDYSRCIKMLRSGGRYLMANPRISDMVKSVLTSMFSDKTVSFAFAGEKREELVVLKEMIEAGKIKAVVDKVYPLAHAAEAHRRVENEQRLGPVVISMGKS